MFWKDLLHFTFIAGVLTQFLKLTDFLISKDQQKWIQDQAELIALRVDAVKPLNFYRTLITKRNIKFLTIAYIVSAPLFIIVPPFFEIELQTGEQIPFVFACLSGTIAFGYLINWVFQKHGQSNVEYFYAGGKFQDFFIRYLKSMMRGAAFIIIYSMWYILTPLFPEHWQIVIVILPGVGFIILLFIKFGEVLLWYAFQFIGLIICATWLALFVLSTIVALVRGIVWRIATYNKGAMAAITLLITLILGIVELYLRQKK